MSCEGRRLPSAGSGFITTSLHLLELRLPLEVERLFTERSSASEKLVFKIQVIRRPRVQMDGFLRLFVFSPLLSHSWIHDAGNKAASCSLHQSGIQGSGSNVILCPTLNSSQRWGMTSAQSLTHSDNYHCKQSSAGLKSNTKQLPFYMWAASQWGRNRKERERKRLSETLLNLFLTEAEFIHPGKHHFSGIDLLIHLYSVRVRCPQSIACKQGQFKCTSPVIGRIVI